MPIECFGTLKRFSQIELFSTPMLMIQGDSDSCDNAKESEGLEKYFAGRHQRLLLAGIGHFPHREAPLKVSDAATLFLRKVH